MARTPYQVPVGWLSRAQAARYLDVSQATFVRIADRQSIVPRLDKGVFLYRADDVETLAQMRAK